MQTTKSWELWGYSKKQDEAGEGDDGAGNTLYGVVTLTVRDDLTIVPSTDFGSECFTQGPAPEDTNFSFNELD